GELALAATPELVHEEVCSGRAVVDDENLVPREALASEPLDRVTKRVRLAVHDGDVERATRQLVDDGTKVAARPIGERRFVDDRSLEAPIEMSRKYGNAATGRTGGHRVHSRARDAYVTRFRVRILGSSNGSS